MREFYYWGKYTEPPRKSRHNNRTNFFGLLSGCQRKGFFGYAFIPESFNVVEIAVFVSLQQIVAACTKKNFHTEKINWD
ncbi:MAG: hypothetical protein KGJ59_11380 [Bacteroidota bacterium]|nr:hypothetical protein [Bacteroidota bacterium]